MNETYYPEVVQCVPGSGKSVYAYFSDGNIRLYDVSHVGLLLFWEYRRWRAVFPWA